MKKTTKRWMKGIQIASVAGLTTIMLCENITPVSGLEAKTEFSATIEESGRTWNQLNETEQIQLMNEDPDLAQKMKDAQAVEDSQTAADTQESTDTTTEPTDTTTPEAPETPDTETPDTETPDAETPETPDTETPDTETPDTETPDTETPDTETPDTTTPDTTTPDSPESSVQVPTEDAEVETVPDNSTTINDTNTEAVYEQKDYNPSEAFISRSEKITYNESVPIEGLPKFITQEMIIGALKCQDETGYPASVTIAQIIQESGFGQYGDGGDEGQGLSYLAYQYCNLFGIKGTGTAGSVNMMTGEQTSAGESYTITAGFRAYHTYTECIEDRTQLLQRVYGDLTEGVTDANTFATQIGGRWATSITYSQNLIKQMEYYDLYRLDKMTLQDFSDMIGTFTNPCPGATLTSTFGYRTYDNSFHKGIDLGTGSENIPTYAAASGTVTQAGWSDSAGNWVVIDHGNGLVTKYMHHSEIYVTVGQQVEKGQQIGLSGTTGDSSGNHLHFQVEENGVAVDPTPYLSGGSTQSVKMTTVSTQKSTVFKDSVLSKLRAKLTKKNNI